MQTPHSYRRQMIHTWILCLILIIVLAAASCTATRRPKDPCKERRGMSGYGYGWLKNNETKNVFILDSNGAVICTFNDPAGMFKSRQ